MWTRLSDRDMGRTNKVRRRGVTLGQAALLRGIRELRRALVAQVPARKSLENRDELEAQLHAFGG